MTARYPFTPATTLLLAIAGIGGGVAWLSLRFAIFGGASANVSDFLVGFASSCAVGALLMARFGRR